MSAKQLHAPGCPYLNELARYLLSLIHRACCLMTNKNRLFLNQLKLTYTMGGISVTVAVAAV